MAFGRNRRLTEADKAKARKEFERRRASSSDTTVTSSTSFDSFLTTYIATDGYGSGSVWDSGSSSSCDTSSSYSDSGSSSSCDSSSSSSCGGGGCGGG